MWLSALRAIALLGTLGSIAYLLIAVWSIRIFQSSRQKKLRGEFTPSVSILKPLCGRDRYAFECIASQFVQDYPQFEIIFGVSDADDPVIKTVEEVKQDFPHVPAKLVLCPEILGTNRKVSNLIQMLPHVQGEFIVINDSDILVPHDYLVRVLAPLDDPTVGLVTCLYSGILGDRLGSKLEAIGIASDFVPGVLVARYIEDGLHFALGSTLALSRRTLSAIGGFEAVVDYLADDYQIGYRVSQTGRRVELADCVVEHSVPEYSFRTFVQHQLRWARTVRISRPFGYAGLILTFALPWSLLALAATRAAPEAWLLFVLAMSLRYALALGTQKWLLRDRIGLYYLTRGPWLLPVRDLLGVLIWIGSYLGRTVVWRGHKFQLVNGKLRPV